MKADLSYRKLLLSTMHIVIAEPSDHAVISDQSLAAAMTLSENLHSLGFSLTPQGIGKLAASRSLEDFYGEVRELVPEVKAAPLYPDFPLRVMEISEAQFRFHQLVHYWSTYGLEWLTGSPVSRGWLPNEVSTPKAKSDVRLLDDTVLEIVSGEESYELCLRRILQRRERLTLAERELVILCLPHAGADLLSEIQIPFKENLALLFSEVFVKIQRDEAVRVLRHLCRHSGDVLRCISLLLKERKYHLRTSEKRTLVRLLESYPAANLRENLILSDSKRERNLVILRHLDFNRYARSAAHKKAVADLRSKKLRSWQGAAQKKLLDHESGALGFVAKRPGYMLRILGQLLSLGYEEEEITSLLCQNAAGLSTQMLVKLLSDVCGKSESLILKEKEKEIDKIRTRFTLLRHNNAPRSYTDLINAETIRHSNALSSAKGDFDRALQQWSESALFARQQGELEKTMEIWTEQVRILTQAQRAKEFALKKSLSAVEAQIALLEKSIPAHNATQNYSIKLNWLERNALRQLRRLSKQKKRLEKELAALGLQVQSLHPFIHDPKDKIDEIERRYALLRQQACEERARLRREFSGKEAALERAHERRLGEIGHSFSRYRLKSRRNIMRLNEQEAKEITQTVRKFDRRLHSIPFVPVRRRIMEKALFAHLEAIETPIRGRKIFLDQGLFDLSHSLMKTTDKSQDSTYVRSGFAWRIPDEATCVRFFVYWNDRGRVDLDLHASAATDSEDLSWFHVGWNSDFRSNGVCHSGDLTHSDAAEYIDVDLSSPVRYVTMNIDLYSGSRAFGDIDECYVGLMGVKYCGKDVRLYNPANCFFTHELRQDCRFLHYGYIDTRERYVRFVGEPDRRSFASHLLQDPDSSFYVRDYLDILFRAQGACPVDGPAQADVILSVEKSKNPTAISLIDSNFFMDA